MLTLQTVVDRCRLKRPSLHLGVTTTERHKRIIHLNLNVNGHGPVTLTTLQPVAPRHLSEAIHQCSSGKLRRTNGTKPGKRPHLPARCARQSNNSMGHYEREPPLRQGLRGPKDRQPPYTGKALPLLVNSLKIQPLPATSSTTTNHNARSHTLSWSPIPRR